ncbi:hypothetical protein V5G52_10675 [Trueperella pyogenes]
MRSSLLRVELDERVLVEGDDAAEVRRALGLDEGLLGACVGHGETDFRVFEYPAHLFGGVRLVDRHDDETGAEGGEVDETPLVRGGSKDGDSLTFGKPFGDEAAGDGVDVGEVFTGSEGFPSAKGYSAFYADVVGGALLAAGEEPGDIHPRFESDFALFGYGSVAVLLDHHCPPCQPADIATLP